jgi:hypothetical protein
MSTDTPFSFPKRARVEAVEHPKGIIKAKVRVLGLWDDTPLGELPWAEYQFPVGIRANDGDFSPVQVNDIVWVRFDEGDPRFPIITGSAYFAPDNKPLLPGEVHDPNGSDVHTHIRTADQPTPDAPMIHQDRITRQFGFLTELTQAGAYRLTHTSSGTAIEITKAGEVVLHVVGNYYHSTTAGHGQPGNVIATFAGDLNNHTKGKINVQCDSGINITANNAVTLTAGGTVDVTAKHINLNGADGKLVTTAHKCHYTGFNHGDGSSKSSAGK